MDWKEWTVRPHDLRHSYFVMLRDSGVNLKLAIKWMGHADEKMILRIYDHVTELRMQNAIKNINDYNDNKWLSNGCQKNPKNGSKPYKSTAAADCSRSLRL